MSSDALTRAPRLQARGLCKSFSGRQVLRDADLGIERGQVHALLGMNGSGKSTLVKVLTGNHQPDAGRIIIGGVERKGLASPKQAFGLGIRVVHQEAPLVDNLSVAECIALFRAYPTGATGRICWSQLRRESRALLERFDIDVDPDDMAGELSAADRALVALAIALGDIDIEAMSLLILDEASASIPEAEADRFLARIRALAQDGLPVLMVTHRLHEVSAIADQVTVLHDGSVVHQGPSAELSQDDVVQLIAGARLGADAPDTAATPVSKASARRPAAARSVPVLEVVGLTAPPLDGATFQVAQGEFLGVVGGPESGIAQLPLAMVGGLPGATGRMCIDGKESPLPTSPRKALKAGIVLVPRDRLREGAVGSLSIHENVLLATARRYWHRGSLANTVVQQVIGDFDVRPTDDRVLVRDLSGGNQQKIIIGKWLTCDPRVIVLDDPTSGVDPGARSRIFRVLRDKVEAGLSVILFSTEVDQLVDHCHRVITIEEGRVTGELTGDDLSRTAVARLAVA